MADDDDEDMAWRTAVPMTPQQIVLQQEQMAYHQFHAVMQAQQATLQQQIAMGMQQALAQQMTLHQMYGAQMYLEQGGMFSHGAYWSVGQTFCGSSLDTTNPANAGWPPGAVVAYTGGLPIFGASCAPAPVEDAGIRAGEVAGFRAWKVGGRGRSLHSMVNHAEWPRDGLMRGEPGDHDGMGVHAFKTPDEARQQYRDSAFAFGRVALWGAIVEHELGYRAEFAKITAIDAVSGVWLSWTLRRLRRHYGLTGHE